MARERSNSSDDYYYMICLIIVVVVIAILLSILVTGSLRMCISSLVPKKSDNVENSIEVYYKEFFINKLLFNLESRRYTCPLSKG